MTQSSVFLKVLHFLINWQIDVLHCLQLLLYFWLFCLKEASLWIDSINKSSLGIVWLTAPNILELFWKIANLIASLFANSHSTLAPVKIKNYCQVCSDAQLVFFSFFLFCPLAILRLCGLDTAVHSPHPLTGFKICPRVLWKVAKLRVMARVQRAWREKTFGLSIIERHFPAVL